MATIQKRGNAYRIKVSCGYSVDGKQIIQSMTWKPSDNMTEKQIEKELQRQTVLFEEACKNGFVSSAVKFEAFAATWLDEYAKPRYKATTLDRMRTVQKRVNDEIGHLRIDKISTRTIQKLISDFQKGNEGKGYKAWSAKSIKNSVSYISSVLEYAIRMGMINENPCKKVLLPTQKTPEKDLYSLEEMQKFVDVLLENAPIQYQCFFILAIYGGFRLGEIMGLTWNDVDFTNNIIHIRQSAYHITNVGIVVETPKTPKSTRSLKLPQAVFDYLKKLLVFYDKQAAKLGTKWIDDNNAVIKAHNGEQLSPMSPYSWLMRFCKRNNLRFVSIHSFRHFNATLLINTGVDVKTVQHCLGHAQASTTLNIYAHSFNEAQAKASEAIAKNFSLIP